VRLRPKEYQHIERHESEARELVAMAPDVIMTTSTLTTRAARYDADDLPQA
jgi:hypothetical protein